jgi:hypothetical protein
MKKLYLIILAFSLVSCLEQATEPKGESIILTDDLPAQFYDWEDFQIINYSPGTSLPDSIVTIYGKAFGVYRDSVEVFFGSYIAELISINDTVLKVKVPDIESERYQIKINIRDTSVTLKPDFNLVRSYYIFNSVVVEVKNIICHLDYSSSWRSGPESGSSSRKDTLIQSFKYLPFYQQTFNDSEGDKFEYHFDNAFWPYGISFRVRGLADKTNSTVQNFFAYKDEWLDKQDGMGGTYNRTMHKISIGLLNCTIVSDTLIKAVMNREMLENTSFSFESSVDSKMSTSSNSQSSSSDFFLYHLLMKRKSLLH